jgi:hypothetical protein
VDLQPVLQGLSDRERVYVESRLKGLSKAASAIAAGTQPCQASKIETPAVVEALEKGRALSIKNTGITRERVIEMLENAYHSAETAQEMVAAARELGRMLGYYEAQKVAVTHEHKVHKAEQLKTLTVDELERLARGDAVIEGEFYEMKDQALLVDGRP